MHQGQAAFGVALTSLIEFSRDIEFFQGIAACRIEQAIEHLFITHLDTEQGFGHQLCDRGEHRSGIDLLPDDHGRCRL